MQTNTEKPMGQMGHTLVTVHVMSPILLYRGCELNQFVICYTTQLLEHLWSTTVKPRGWQDVDEQGDTLPTENQFYYMFQSIGGLYTLTSMGLGRVLGCYDFK